MKCLKSSYEGAASHQRQRVLSSHGHVGSRREVGPRQGGLKTERAALHPHRH